MSLMIDFEDWYLSWLMIAVFAKTLNVDCCYRSVLAETSQVLANEWCRYKQLERKPPASLLQTNNLSTIFRAETG